MKVYNILWLKFLNGSVKNTELGMPFYGVLTVLLISLLIVNMLEV